MLAKYKSNIGLLLCSILVTLAIAEYVLAPIILALTGQPNRSLALLGVAAKPNVWVDDTKINSQGFTGSVISDFKPKDTKRILTLGGSTMFNHRMTERLIDALQRATPTRIEIQGGALRTHTTRDSIIKYKYHFFRYAFDYVIIYDGVNDIWMNHVYADDFRDDYSHAGPWYKRNPILNYSVVARYLYNAMLWKRPKCIYKDLLYTDFRIKLQPKCYNGAKFRAFNTFKKNIRHLVRLVLRDRGTPILVTHTFNIPDNYTLKAFRRGMVGYNNPKKYDECPVELWGSVDYVQEAVRRNNGILRNIAKEEHVLLIDQERIFPHDISKFGDPFHLTEEGTDIFVKNIVDFFISQKLLPARVETRLDAKSGLAEKPATSQ